MDASTHDVEAARALERYLLDGMARIEAGTQPSVEQSDLLYQVAMCLPDSVLAENARTLKDEDCWTIADTIAGNYSAEGDRPDLFAQVALARAPRLEGEQQVDAARTRLEEALARHPRTEEAPLCIELAEIARYRGAKETLDAFLARARPALGAIDDAATRAYWTQRLELIQARAWIDLGAVDQAWSAYRRAHEAAELGSPKELQLQRLEEAVFLMASDDLAGAAALTEELVADKDLAPELRGHALLRRGIVRFAAGRAAERIDPRAKDDMLAALKEPLTPGEQSTIRLRLAEIELAQGELEAARARLAALAPDFDLDGAHAANADVFERALYETLSSRLARAAHAPEDELRALLARLMRVQDAILDHWRKIEPIPGGVGYLHFGRDSDALIELCSLELALDGKHGAERCLAHLIEAQKLGSSYRRLSNEALSLASVQAVIPEHGLLLAYLYGQEQSFLFVVDATGVTNYPLRSSLTLHPKVQEFADLFSVPPESLPPTLRASRRAKGEELARALAIQLIPDAVEARMRAATHVTVVGEDVRDVFPFEALRCVDGSWLGTVVALDHWPSLPMGVFLAGRARREHADKPHVLALAAAHNAPQYGAVFELSADERRGLAQGWKGLELVSGEQATAAALRQRVTSNPDALLLLVHGAYESERTLPAGLALTPSASTPGAAQDDGRVWCEDIQHLRAPELVVLGACGTGRGHERRGEDGSVHMGNAWFSAGSRCVIQSAFELEKDSTLAQLTRLGLEHRPGVSLAEAMRATRAWRAARQPDRPEAFYSCLLRRARPFRPGC